MEPSKKLIIWFLLVSVVASSSEISSRKVISHQFLNLFKTTREAYLNSNGIYIDTTAISNLCPKHSAFHSMNPAHMKAVGEMRSILMRETDLEKTIQIAEYLKHDPNVNVMAWYNAVNSWALKDPRMAAIPKPSPVDVSPDEFINNVAMAEAYRRMESSTKLDECIVVDGSAGVDNGPENALWYFREDLMLNAHHQFYHNSYPFQGDYPDREDRRGELFYYFHKDAVARYNAERLSNNMIPVKALEWKQAGSILEEGYYPHLNETVTGDQYSDREPNTPLSDTEALSVFIQDLDVIRNRLLVTAESGIFILSNGSTLLINNTQGVDIFGDALEQNLFSLNSDYYGKGVFGLHNNMHVAIAYSPDPSGELGLPGGVMLNIATSFRDIIFYRWHMYINHAFDMQKRSLVPYSPHEGELQLVWDGITVSEIGVELVNSNSSNATNQLQTFFTQKEFPLRKGLDHSGNFTDSPPLICAKHLDHEEFYYKIVVNNTHANPVPATIRLFLAPRYDETGSRFDMLTQRDFLFNLDVFTTNLTQGENTILRHSNESNAAIPWHKALDELENDETPPSCGCGFPMHLQIPRGKPEGMAYDLVVLVTNGEDDAVQHEETDCAPAYLYCGLLNTRYPDSKPMGYPFDRLPYSVNGDMVPDLDSYVGNVPNMRTVQVNISHVEN